MISGNMVGMYSSIGKTFILTDENGNEVTGVCVDNPVVFTAGDNDVRENIVYAGDSGVSVGTKIIPIYHARYGEKFVLANQEATLIMPEYDYDSLMVTISTYSSSLSDSVVSTYLSVYDAMYVPGNNTKMSDIIIDKENQKINLGITVNEKSVLRYFVLKEEF
jgi:hypothetical protein